MTRSLVASGRWSLTPGTLVLETIRAGDCGRSNQRSPKTDFTVNALKIILERTEEGNK